MKLRPNQLGFSLLEMLVVVSIILIVSAIAIPRLLQSKMRANEASAVGSLRVINSACITYSSNWGKGYPPALSNLGPAKPATSTAADLIDSVVAGRTKSGYQFVYVSGAPSGGTITTYAINANPLQPGVSGTRYFFADQSGVIRYNLSAPATVADAPLP